jgi:hypothetical protein
LTRDLGAVELALVDCDLSGEDEEEKEEKCTKIAQNGNHQDHENRAASKP